MLSVQNEGRGEVASRFFNYYAPVRFCSGFATASRMIAVFFPRTICVAKLKKKAAPLVEDDRR